jgi:hypothetical protein
MVLIKITVDRAFSEWDKHCMSNNLQQLVTSLQGAVNNAAVSVTRVPLIANKVVLLVLVIIPTISGAALIT